MATAFLCPDCGSTLIDSSVSGSMCLRCFLENGVAAKGADGREAPLAGRKFGRFQVLEKIGEGGMAEVYLAEDEKLERKVALKFLSEVAQRDAVIHARFARETKAAAALDHPFIGKIYDTGRQTAKPISRWRTSTVKRCGNGSPAAPSPSMTQ